jgi:magnesium chelatase accessory protein
MAEPTWDDWHSVWPNAERSRFVRAASLDWHVQEFPAPRSGAPTILLIHGSGGATHSWAPLVPFLTADWRVIGVDLPGHGFTAMPADPSRLSLTGMAADLATLLDALGVAPDVVVGHSAGAAVLLRMALDRRISPRAIVGINAALAEWPDWYRDLLSPFIAAVATLPIVARLAAWQASGRGAVDRLLASTGSSIPVAQRAWYALFARSATHDRAVLTMMANWDVNALWRDLPSLETPVTLIAGDRDRWVPPAVAERSASRLRHARVVVVPGTGHLTMEEAPAAVARIIDAS